MYRYGNGLLNRKFYSILFTVFILSFSLLSGAVYAAQPSGELTDPVFVSGTETWDGTAFSFGSEGQVIVPDGASLTINGGDFDLSAIQAHAFAVEPGGSLILNGVKVQNLPDRVGVIHVSGGTLEIKTSEFTNNHGNRGGVILADNASTVTITGSNFTNNSARQGGGVILAEENSTVIISGSGFADNNANNGGAIRMFGGALNITDSEFTGNNARSDNRLVGGGAIQASNSAVTIHNSKFTDNYAGTGGAIQMQEGGSLNITGNSEFTGNRSLNTTWGGDGTGGGAIRALLTDIYIEDGLFEGNSAVNYGGAILMNGGSLTIGIKKDDYDSYDHTDFTGKPRFINNSVTHSTSSVRGGAIAVETECDEKGNSCDNIRAHTLTINNALFQGNVSTFQAGALSLGYSTKGDKTKGNMDNPRVNVHATIDRADFIGNQVTNNTRYNVAGGAVLINTNAELYMEDAAFVGNHAANVGGAIASCMWGSNFISMPEGAAIYGNTAGNPLTERDENGEYKDIYVMSYDSTYHPTVIGDQMYHGGSHQWAVKTNGITFSTGGQVYNGALYGYGGDPEDMHYENHKVLFLNNSAEADMSSGYDNQFQKGNGGAIGNNGTLNIGTTQKAFTDITLNKTWIDEENLRGERPGVEEYLEKWVTVYRETSEDGIEKFNLGTVTKTTCYRNELNGILEETCFYESPTAAAKEEFVEIKAIKNLSAGASDSSEWKIVISGLRAMVRDTNSNWVPVTWWALEKAPESEKETNAYGMEFNKYIVTDNDVDITDHNYTFTNELNLTDISGEKTWIYNDAEESEKPSEIWVHLHQNGISLRSTTEKRVTAADNWSWSYERLPKYDAKGNLYDYYVHETYIPNYQDHIEHQPYSETSDITNEFVRNKTRVYVFKHWDDDANRDGLRVPVKFVLYEVKQDVPGQDVRTKIAEYTLGINETSYVFDNLPLYYETEPFDLIRYAVEEETQVPEYNQTCTPHYYTEAGIRLLRYECTNEYTPKTVSVSATKTWDDENNKYDTRPKNAAEIQEFLMSVRLYAGNTPFRLYPITYVDGTNFEYRATGPYGKTYPITVTINGDVWTLSCSGLPMNDMNHQPIDWRLKEGHNKGYKPYGIAPDGSLIEVPAAGLDGEWDANSETFYYNVRNSLDEMMLTITKDWNDNNNYYGDRPTVDEFLAGIKLYKNGVFYDHGGFVKKSENVYGINAHDKVLVTLENTDTDHWIITVDHLPKREGNIDINWLISEVLPEYDSKVQPVYDNNDLIGFDLTNQHLLKFPVTKVWDDDNNRDGLRPASITIELLANGNETGDTLTLSDANGWTDIFMNLPVVDDSGNPIQYDVREVGVDTSVYTLVKIGTADYYTGFQLTNTHDIARTQISVTKVWNDLDNHYNLRPSAEEFMSSFKLLADNVEFELRDLQWSWNPDHTSATITASSDTGDVTITLDTPANSNTWTITFSNLPARKNVQNTSKVINWTISESAAHYTPQVTSVTGGFNVVNTLEYTNLTLTKIWEDDSDAYGERPEPETFLDNFDIFDNAPFGKFVFREKIGNDYYFDSDTETYAVLTDNGNNTWTITYEKLPLYPDGTTVPWTIDEDIPNYFDVVNGMTVTNKWDKVTISGTKIWSGDDAALMYRPKAVTIYLTAVNNPNINEVTQATEETGWAWEFTDLPKYNPDGSKINFVVKEKPVPNYSSTITGVANKEYEYVIENTYSAGTIDIPVAKTWDDGKDRDGIRPLYIDVILVVNGVDSNQKGVLNHNNNWTYKFEKLPLKDTNGDDITYDVKEVFSDSRYQKTKTGDASSGFSFVNTHVPATTSVSISKTWVDMDNQYDMRPAPRAFVSSLQLYANGNSYDLTGWTDVSSTGDTFVFTAKATDRSIAVDRIITVTLTGYGTNLWSVTYDNLPLNALDSHKPVVWAVQETVPHYTAQINGGSNNAFDIINTLEYTSLTLTKNWEGDTANNRPEPGVLMNGLELYAGNVRYQTGTFVEEWNNGAVWKFHSSLHPEITAEVAKSAQNTWKVTIDMLPRFVNGTTAVWSVKETVENYFTTVSGTTITNKWDRKSISGTKTWDGDDYAAAYRPKEIIVHLIAGNANVHLTTTAKAPDWTWKFENLHIYNDAGKEIIYSVYEEPVVNYNNSVVEITDDQYDIKNTYNRGKTQVSVSKTWLDDGNRDGLRPRNITVILQPGDRRAVLPVNGKWEYTFTDLPVVDADGKTIVYSVEEVSVEGYDSEVTGTYTNGFNIRNIHESERTEIVIRKTWNDLDNVFGVRPDVDKFVKSLVLYADSSQFDLTQLTLVSQDGTSYHYTAQSSAGEILIDVTVTDNNHWTLRVAGLPVHDLTSHHVIRWTVDESAANYTTTITGNMDNGFDVVNDLELTTLTITKKWEGDSDTVRPEPIKLMQGITLYANNQPYNFGAFVEDGNDGTTWNFRTSLQNVGITAKLTKNDANTWTVTFENLPGNYRGEKASWTVKESLANYFTEISGTTITNKWNLVTISGKKTWTGDADALQYRPTEVIINLYAENAAVDDETVAYASQNWSWKFVDLPKYTENGELIRYYVQEEPVPNYSSKLVPVSGSEYEFDIENTYTEGLTEIPVTKRWIDGENRDGIRPNYIEVVLVINGVDSNQKGVLNHSNNWTYKFEKLPLKDTEGKNITYDVKELFSDSRYQSIKTGNAKSGFTFINSYKPAVTSVSISKTWADMDNIYGMRPDVKTFVRALKLIANGNSYELTGLNQVSGSGDTYVFDAKAADNRDITITLTGYGTDQWNVTYENLPQNALVSHHPVVWTVEETVPNYTAVITGDQNSGFDITNTLNYTFLTLTKKWEGDTAAVRPDPVVLMNGLELYAGNAHYQTGAFVSEGNDGTVWKFHSSVHPEIRAEVAETAQNTWIVTIDMLPRYVNGKEAVWSVKETIANYFTSVSGTTITNKWDLTKISGIKTWEGDDYALEYRPTEIIVHLSAANADVELVTTAKAPSWTWSFDNLRKYNDAGKEIDYSVYEEPVKNYSSSVTEIADNQYEIVNTYNRGKTQVPVSKTWLDDGNRDGLRPRSITVTLQPGDRKAVLPVNGKWEYTFTNLPVVDSDGKTIVYSVEEVSVDGYDTEITGTYTSGFHITNIHKSERTEIVIRKTWNDLDNVFGVRPDVDKFVKSLVLYADNEKFDLNPLNLVSQDGSSYRYTAQSSAGEILIDVTVADNNYWTIQIAGLPVRDLTSHHVIRWTVDESTANYTTTISGNTDNGFDMVNDLELTTLTITKKWEGDNDTVRPEPINLMRALTLYANNQPYPFGNFVEERHEDSTWYFTTSVPNVGITAKLTKNDANTWTVTFENLPGNYKGERATWTVKENLTNYFTEISGNTITNKWNLVTISGEKTWSGDADALQYRPTEVIINLYAENAAVDDETVAYASQNWSWKFVDLPKYTQNGELIRYYVQEDPVPNYSSKLVPVSGNEYEFIIENTYTEGFREIPVTKEWFDDNNRDGLRPDFIEVVLLINGEESNQKGILDHNNNWKYTFTKLPIKDGSGNNISYDVKELSVPDYVSVKSGSMTSGFLFRNSHAPALTEITISKTWSDYDDRYGLRPDAEKLVRSLTLNANGIPFPLANLKLDTQHGSTSYEFTADGAAGKVKIVVEISDKGVWNIVISGLPENDQQTHKPINWTVDELLAHYTPQISGDMTDGFSIVNTLNYVPLEITKVWEGDSAQNRPDPVELMNALELYASSEPFRVGPFVETGNEGGVLKFRSSIDPDITAELVLTDSSVWTVTINKLPRVLNGLQVSWTVKEKLPGYFTTIDGTTITNKWNVVTISGTKSWSGDDYALDYRPTSVIIHLTAENADVNETTTASQAANWEWKFENLSKYDEEGNEIIYSFFEEPIVNYTRSLRQTGENRYEIINTYHENYMDIPVSKEWMDDDNRDDLRPTSVTIILQPLGKTVTLPQNGKWEYTFEDLPVKDNAGNVIPYSVQELSVDEYTTVIEGNSTTGFNVKNTHETEKVELTISKIWDDLNDRYQLRPSVYAFLNALTLKAGDVPYVFDNLRLVSESEGSSVYSAEASAGSVTITVEIVIDNNWNVTVSNLPKYDLETHEPITWDVEETLSAYTVQKFGNMTDGFSLLNKLDYTSLELTKDWDDNNNAEGKRPDPEVFLRGIELFAGREPYYPGPYVLASHEGNTWIFRTVGSASDVTVSLTETYENIWNVTFDKLPRFMNGSETIWSVEEKVYGYQTKISGDMERGFLITNKLDLTTISGSKTWNHTSADGVTAPEAEKPAQIIIHLHANGEKIDEMVVTEDDNWSWTFADLPKYNENGEEIQYSVHEQPIRDYDSETVGYDINNTYAPNHRNLPVYKVWNDDNNRDGLRSQEIRVFLLADGTQIDEAVLNDANGWYHEFKQLDVYGEDNVTEIVYTVEEDPDSVPAGYQVVVNGSMDEGYEIVNTHTPETVNIEGIKRWDDRGNEGARPESVTIRLHANGVEVRKTTALEKTGWKWGFENLPAKENGVNIVYTVTEDTIDNYVTTINEDTFEITNRYEPGKVSLTVSKVWVDNENRSGVRPESVSIILLENGEYLGRSVELNEDNKWTYVFSELDETRNGEPIHYTVRERNGSDLYHVSIDGNPVRGYTITNTLENETIDIEIMKIWDDEDNKDNKRPSEITVFLYADGEFTGKVLTLTEAEGWRGVFSGLEKYAEDGVTEIRYTVVEGPITGYILSSIDDSAVTLIILTNKYKPEKPDFPFKELPKTGITGSGVMGSQKPASVRYTPVNMDLLIPSLELTTPIVWVSPVDGSYPVEWLGSDAGLMIGTALPGQGLSVIAGHNTLSSDEYGPFALISELKVGDRLFVRSANGNLMNFEVYANTKLVSDDVDGLYELASRYDSSLTLLTCEDELPEGGYAARRVIAARPR